MVDRRFLPGKSNQRRRRSKKLFRGDMGPELMNANDKCIRNRAGCVPPGLEGKP
jgi:hypothetical protein